MKVELVKQKPKETKWLKAIYRSSECSMREGMCVLYGSICIV